MSRRNFGSVDRLPSGRFRARYLGPDGERRTAPVTFPTKTEASRWLSKTETEVAQGRWLDPSVAHLTVRAYAEAWLSQRTVKGKALAPRTAQTYRHSLDAWILPKLGDKRLESVTPALVRTWHAETLSKTGPTATRQAYALLRAIFNTAVADEALHRNPCRIAGAGQPNSPERPLLDLEQVEKLIEAMPDYLQTLTLVTFWAHLRLGEVLGLQRRDIDLTAGTLRVERQQIETKEGSKLTPPKASSQRTVHLPQQAIEALREWLTSRPGLPTAPVFTRRDGSQLRQWHVEWHWREARRKACVEGAPHFHDLRHAGLTLTAQLGATQAELMRRAGHSTARAAAIYQHAAESRDKDLAAKLSQLPTRSKRSS